MRVLEEDRGKNTHDQSENRHGIQERLNIHHLPFPFHGTFALRLQTHEKFIDIVDETAVDQEDQADKGEGESHDVSWGGRRELLVIHEKRGNGKKETQAGGG